MTGHHIALREASTGRVGRKSLSRGRYLVTATARDAAGNVSKKKTATFKVVRR